MNFVFCKLCQLKNAIHTINRVDVVKTRMKLFYIKDKTIQGS